LLERVVRFSVSIPPSLLEEFDAVTEGFGYNRSSAVQAAMREFLTEKRWTMEEKGGVAGAITMIYAHHVRGLRGRLTETQHNHREVISSTIHVHLDDENCLEIIAVKGAVKAIRDLAGELMTTRGLKQLKIAILMTD